MRAVTYTVADLNLNVPAMRKGASAEEKIDSLYRYANQLNDQLMYVLNNLDIDSMNEEVAAKLRNAIAVTAEGGGMQQQVQELKADIVKNAEVIRSESESLRTALTGYELAVSNLGSLLTTATTILEANNYGVNIKTEVAEYINSIFGGAEAVKEIVGDEGARGQQAKVTQYTGNIQAGYVDEYGSVCLILSGKRDSGNVMKSIHTPERVVFKNGDEVKGHFGANDMYIDDCRTHSLRFAGTAGDAATQYFSIVPVMTGNDRGLELRWGDTEYESGIVG